MSDYNTSPPADWVANIQIFPFEQSHAEFHSEWSSHNAKLTNLTWHTRLWRENHAEPMTVSARTIISLRPSLRRKVEIIGPTDVTPISDDLRQLFQCAALTHTTRNRSRCSNSCGAKNRF